MEKKPPSALSSLLQQKCPRCRTAHPFINPTYSYSFLKMHKRCPNCNLDFNPEPGFYWGAMYISYGFNAGIAIVISVLLWFTANPSLEVYIAVVLGISTLLGPAVIRYSRLLLLFWLGEAKFTPSEFNPDYKKNTETPDTSES